MVSRRPGMLMFKTLFCISDFRADRRAVTALEYGILASVLGLVLVSIFSGLGSTMRVLFNHVGSSI